MDTENVGIESQKKRKYSGHSPGMLAQSGSPTSWRK